MSNDLRHVWCVVCAVCVWAGRDRCVCGGGVEVIAFNNYGVRDNTVIWRV